MPFQVISFQELPFPLVQAYVDEVTAQSQAPIGLVWATVFAALSAAVQGCRDVRLSADRILPTSLFVLIAAESGERKTSVMKMVFRAIREFEISRLDEFERESKEYKSAFKKWKSTRAALDRVFQKSIIKGEGKKNAEADLDKHDACEPRPPRKVRLLYEDATYQAVMLGLAREFPNATFASSEGAAILKSSIFREMTKLNSLWSRDDIVVDRASRESFRISNASMTMLIMVQPSFLREYLDDAGELSRGSGLLARFITCDPGSTKGMRFFNGSKPNDTVSEKFERRIADLLEESVSIQRGRDLARKPVGVSPEAFQKWKDYFNYVEMNQAHGLRYENLSDHASKLAEIAARLAAILHAFEGFDGDISSETMECAISFCEASSRDFERLFVPVPQVESDAAIVGERIARMRVEGKGRFLRKNEVRQSCYRGMRGPRIYAALDLLAERRVIAYVDGEKRTELIDIWPEGPVSLWGRPSADLKWTN